MIKKSKKNNNGFVALTSVILLSAVILYVISSLAMQIIDNAEIGSAHEQSVKSKYLTYACAEYVFFKLKNNPNFVQSSPITINNEECEYEISTVGGNKIVSISSQVGNDNYTSQFQITISTTTPNLVIEEWEMNADLEM